MPYRPLVIIFAIIFGAGCSALVSPDEGRLGGDDAGSDSGTGDASDSGRPDARDSGRPDASDGGGDCPFGCDDGVPCTMDRCTRGACENRPSNASCDPGEVCDPVLGCATASCSGDAECDDGVFCNGSEACSASDPRADDRGCVPGVAMVCDDGSACTADACDEDAEACASTPNDALCDDGIDCTVNRCRPEAGRADENGCVMSENDARCVSAEFCTVGLECIAAAGGCVGGTPRDCSDGDFCTTDSCDASAGMCVNIGRDEDGDGYTATSIAGRPCATGTDCNDFNPGVNPGATELCNGQDDDCNGLVDDACMRIPDTCGSAEPISVVVGGTTSVTGRLGDFGADYNSICAAGLPRDAVYYVDITSGVDLTIDTIGSTADTILSVSTVCSQAGFNATGCDNDIDVGVDRDSRVWVHRFGPPAGTPSVRLYILVGGATTGVVGDFTLSVSAVAAAADTCTAPIDITGGGALVGFIAPGITGLLGATGSCQPPGSGTLSEAVAIFGASDTESQFRAFSSFFDPDVYVRAAPCASGTEVACTAGDGTGAAGFLYETAASPSLVVGDDYYLFVDGVSANSHYFVSYQP